MTDRDRFLARVADRLGEGIPANPLRPMPPLRDDDEVAYAVDLSDPAAEFARAASQVGVELVEDGAADLNAMLRSVVSQLAVRRAVVSRDPECDGIVPALESLGVAVLPPGDAEAAARADLGITGALAGIALTGSLVIDTRRSGTRLASLLPDVHLALLRRASIVATPGQIFRHLDRWLPAGLPSSLILITGPSRSADIELELTIGVHGPRRLLVALR